MDEQPFNELVTNIKQAGQFFFFFSEPSRTFSFDKPDVKTIREKTGLSNIHTPTGFNIKQYERKI